MAKFNEALQRELEDMDLTQLQEKYQLATDEAERQQIEMQILAIDGVVRVEEVKAKKAKKEKTTEAVKTDKKAAKTNKKAAKTDKAIKDKKAAKAVKADRAAKMDKAKKASESEEPAVSRGELYVELLTLKTKYSKNVGKKVKFIPYREDKMIIGEIVGVDIKLAAKAINYKIKAKRDGVVYNKRADSGKTAIEFINDIKNLN